MKNNQPINNQQRHFEKGSNLVSVTDLNGVIEYVNTPFIEISGFTEAELLGQNHHIVRHPDMPEAAFADLWATIKADKEWRGLVKNRCKDGGYYWVDAYVIPVFKNGVKVGYQSVRSVPTEKQIRKAEALYSKMRADKSLKIVKKVRWVDISIAKKTFTMIAFILVVMAILLTLTIYDAQQTEQLFIEQLNLLKNLPDQQLQYEKLQLYNTQIGVANYVVCFLILFASIAILCFGWIIQTSLLKPSAYLREQLRKMAGGDFTQDIEVNNNDEVGKSLMAVKLLQARLRTVLEQFVHTTLQLVSSSDGVSASSNKMQAGMQEQSDKTHLMATAMTEMLASVEEVSNSASIASKEAASADSNVNNGSTVVNNAHRAMTQLSDEVKETAGVIDKLAEESNQISSITDTISSIADQTNLLALNAAIEAARAGEQGRGFAVVADEVRSLASRTQEATQQIRTMIDNLHSGISGAVSAMEGNIQQVSLALTEVETSKESFNSISIAINQINEMNLHIATAAEQQQQVSEEMNQNIISVNERSDEANEEAGSLQDSALRLSDIALSLQNQLDTIDIGGCETSFDFDGAKQAHLAWKTRIRTYLDGDHSVLTKEQACSHHDCKLGQWYYSEGKKKYNSNTSFRQIEAPHEQLHKVIKKIVDVSESGNQDEAEALYQQIDPLSQEIVALIDKTKNSI